MVYEKIRVQPLPEEVSIADDSGPDNCTFCNRPKTEVACGNCMKKIGTNVRTKKLCQEHPRNIFTMDLTKCPTCKSPDLREKGIDCPPGKSLTLKPSGDITVEQKPVQLVNGAASEIGAFQLNPTAVSFLSLEMETQPPKLSPLTTQFVSSSASLKQLQPEAIEQDTRAVLSGNASRQNIFETAGADPTKLKSNVLITSASDRQTSHGKQGSIQKSSSLQLSATSASRTDCPCNRKIKWIYCEECGFYNGEPKVMKFMPCSVHPEVKTGLQNCPECGVGAEHLNEG